jgi:CheY-like chemotaxis protein
MSGSIHFSSNPGVGSKFWFVLPLPFEEACERPAGPVAEPAAEPAPCRVYRILVAEDNRVNQRVIVGLLEKLGCAVELAADGRIAVQMALEGGFDLVLMDFHMPEMNGADATRAIRAGLPTGKRLPIVALTASVMEWERERCMTAGMDDVIGKPVRLSDLERIFEKWIIPAPMENKF